METGMENAVLQMDSDSDSESVTESDDGSHGEGSLVVACMLIT